jgi:hypothetical protein
MTWASNSISILPMTILGVASRSGRRGSVGNFIFEDRMRAGIMGCGSLKILNLLCDCLECVKIKKDWEEDIVFNLEWFALENQL